MKKKFDAVKFQRKIRDGFLRELREKYGHLKRQKAGTHNQISGGG